MSDKLIKALNNRIEDMEEEIAAVNGSFIAATNRIAEMEEQHEYRRKLYLDAASYATTSFDRNKELERRIAAGLACDQHQFVSYKPDLSGRIFFEVADIQAALAPKDSDKQNQQEKKDHE
jgi:roadblock/LC7 domain-containing protein